MADIATSAAVHSEKQYAVRTEPDETRLHGQRTSSPVDPEKRASLPTANKASQKVLAHSHDADEAMKAFESGEVIEIDEATNKRLLRTIDRHLLPLMCLIYGLNYLDKT